MKSSKIIIAVTGTPGSGKTRFSKILKKNLKSFKLIEINDLVNKHHVFSRIDKFNSKVVNLKKLNSVIKNEIKGNTILVGHLAQELKIKFDAAIVIRASLKTIESRLAARKYPKEKIREDILSEALDYCGIKMAEKCKNTIEIETNSDKQKAIVYVKKLASNPKIPKPKIKEINKMPELLKLINKNAI
jgi:broad-specificity NMP kinase